MTTIILAAGVGSRLRPHTNTKPKAMVPLRGRPIIEYQFKVFDRLAISSEDQLIVTGYLAESFAKYRRQTVINHSFDTSNMVHSLFLAEKRINDQQDLIITYGDIVYSEEVLHNLMITEGDIVVSADKTWLDLWSKRLSNPLDDAETFKINPVNGTVIEIGKKPQDYDEIQAQYMGMIKVSRKKIKEFVMFHKRLGDNSLFEGLDKRNMYMTSYIQLLIDFGWEVKPSLVEGSWLEIDSNDDLALYESNVMDTIESWLPK